MPQKLEMHGLRRLVFICIATIVIMTTFGLGLGLSFGLGTDNKNITVEALQNENRVLPRGVTQVSAGYYHTMAIDAHGNLWAFGRNNYGQLGNMSTDDSSMPINITAQTGNPLNGKQIVQVSADGEHTIAIDAQGNLWAFGWNGYGQLGNMSTSSTNSAPINITAQPGNPLNGKQIVQVSVGSNYYTMAIDSQGNLWAFGYNYSGQLGNMSTTNSSTPINITAQSGNPLHGKQIVQVSAGSGHRMGNNNSSAFAIDSSSNLWAWGYGYYGQLGNMSTTSTNSTPINITAQSGNPLHGKQIVQVSAGGDHTTATDSQGNLWTFGDNYYGQLGNMSTTPIGVGNSTPINITAQSGNPLHGKQIVQVSAGGDHTTATDSQGNLWAFGYGSYGQLGNTATDYANSIPIDITEQYDNPLNGKQIVQVSAGYYHTTAIDAQGNLWAFGRNNYGQLGNMSADNTNTPINISAQPGNPLNDSQFGRVQLSAGEYYTVGIDAKGSLWTFGSNYYGQLGNMEDSINSSEPINITAQADNPLFGRRFVQASAGYNHTMAIDSTGNLWAFGQSYSGQLGNLRTDYAINTPICITEQYGNPLYGKQIIQVSAGEGYTMAIDSSGDLWTFGNGSLGQLGNFALDDSCIPINITAQLDNPLEGKQIVQVSAGNGHSTAIDSQGNLWTWGYNSYGQIGNNTAGGYNTVNNYPINITQLYGNPLYGKQIVSVSAGYNRTMAIDAGGNLWMFGYGLNGELGNMSNSSSIIPLNITDQEGNPLYGKQIVQASGGNEHTIVIDAEDNLWAWGRGSHGQLGNMSPSHDYNTPQNITDQEDNPINGSHIIQISAGSYHTMAIDASGNLWAFGQGGSGQLGVENSSSTPINIFLKLPRVKMSLIYSGQSAIGSTMQLADGPIAKSLNLDFEVNEKPGIGDPYILDEPIVITFASRASFSSLKVERVGYDSAIFESGWFLINYDGTNYTMELEIFEIDWDNYILTLETDMILQVQHIYNPPAGAIGIANPDILNLTSADGAGWANKALADPKEEESYGDFLGWYTHPKYGTKITDISQLQQTMDSIGTPIVFLYAHWA